MRCPTNLVTCRRWRRYVKQCGKSVPAILVVFILLVGCAGEPSAPGAARDRFTVLPTPDGVESQPSPTPTENPALAIPEFVVGLLDPGPTLDPIERVFFRNGRDLWQLTGDEVNPALPQGTRFGPYDTAPQGQRVAIVILTEIDSQPAEAIHIIESGAAPGEPLLPPRVTAGRNADPAITALAWSWDATRLGVVYDGPSVAIIHLSPEDGGPAAVTTEITLPDNIRTIESIDWSATGQGLAIVARADIGQASLWVSSLDGELFEVSAASLEGSRSVSEAAWLPGRGRIAFVEERVASSRSLGGSMFSITPNGSGRELLVSSGSFAPAAEIVELAASPGGNFIAFTVNVPGQGGDATFHSLSLVNIDSGELIRVPVTHEFRVTDLWWTVEGLLWRAVHRNAETVDTISDYVGFEPFLIGRFNPDTGESRFLFQSIAD
ncbi:hypothetical protein BH23CHL1_BH23CHL1_07350 [soil metagenome]